MKRKFGTVIEEDIMRLIKRKAAEEGRALALIQDALVQYLRKEATTRKNAKWHFTCFMAQSFTAGGDIQPILSNLRVLDTRKR